MNLLTKRLLIALGFPSLLLILGYVFRQQLLTQQHTSLAQITYLPYLLAVLGMLLSWGFKNARDFYCLLTMMLGYAGLQYLLWHPAVDGNTTLLISGIYFLLPLNLVIHNLLSDRGILSSHGLLHLVKKHQAATLELYFLGTFVSHISRPTHFFAL